MVSRPPLCAVARSSVDRALLQQCKRLPFGLWLFSRALCLKAPYFSSVRPPFTVLEPERGEARIRKRRKVENHLGTVHAIAIANLCEFVAGVTLEITLPATHRWIPKSMKINYLAKANTDVIAQTEISVSSWPDAGSIMVLVVALDTAGTKVVTAEIEMYVSKKK
ncbi:MAG: hotdog fold domain-containing protein [Bdellovibrionota bacterium]